MQGKGVVLVTGDRLGDQLSDLLIAAGCQVIHGPASKPPAMTRLPLDVFEQEPLPPESPLRTLDNVILTPHMVGHSQELNAAIPPTASENVLRVLRGELPLYVKNPEVVPAWQQCLAALETSA